MSAFIEKPKTHGPKMDTPKAALMADKGADLWTKCEGCEAAIYKKDLEENRWVCPQCGHHHKLGARRRLEMLIEPGSFNELEAELKSQDPLEFSSDYLEKLEKDRKKTGVEEAILVGEAKIGPHQVLLGVMDFYFRGGSMGSVVGEKVTRLLERGAETRLPVVMVTASGGARMQEGMFSLMQMAKTTAAVARLNQARVPYITILTDPTTAGVAASFASLGDVILAEPGAIIGFSGARVIEQTIRQKVPEDFQSADYYLKRGFIDRVVHRHELKQTLISLLDYLS